jgi:predicted nucleotidyltransferase
MPILPPNMSVAPAVAAKLPAVAELCLKHRVLRLALFGSGASGGFDAKRGSDLDFLAEFQPMSPREHAGAYFGLMEDLGLLLEVPIDLVEPAAIRNPYFQKAVRNTQVVLYEAA